MRAKLVIPVLMFFILSISVMSIESSEISPYLKHEWRFAYNNTDDTIGEADIALMNEVEYVEKNFTGTYWIGGYKFDGISGTSYMETLPLSLDSGNFSMECWLRPDQKIIDDQVNARIFVQNDTSTGYGHYFQSVNDAGVNNLKMNMQTDNSSRELGNYFKYEWTPSIYQLIGAYNTNTTQEFYINGAFWEGKELTGNIKTDSYAWEFGRLYAGAWFYSYVGEIGGCRIYNISLNASMAEFLYNDGDGRDLTGGLSVINTSLRVYTEQNNYEQLENFYIYANYNYTENGADNGTPITDNLGGCNITLEWKKSSYMNHISLNYNHSNYTENISGISPSPLYNFVGSICHNGIQEANLTLKNIFDSQILSLKRNYIPLCSDSYTSILLLNSTNAEQINLNISSSAYGNNQTITISDAYIEMQESITYPMDFTGSGWRYAADFSYPDEITHNIECYYYDDNDLNKNNTAANNITERTPEIKFTQYNFDNNWVSSVNNNTYEFYEGDYNLHWFAAAYEPLYLFYNISNANGMTLSSGHVIAESTPDTLYNETTDILNWYNFEENSGTKIYDIISNNNGTNNGAIYTSSKGGNYTGIYSLNFTSAYIQVPYKSYYSFGSTKDYALSAWIRTIHGGDGDYHMILDGRDAGNDGIFLAITSSNTIQCTCNSLSMQSIKTITDTNWHHIVCSYDRNDDSISDIWIDGIPENVGILTSNQTISTTANWMIGQRSFSPGIYWEGQLDEIMILNRSVNQAWVNLTYNRGIERGSFGTSSPILYIEGDINSNSFIEIINPYRLDLTIGNEYVNVSEHIYFNINDTIFPIANIENHSVYINTTDEFSVIFQDENFFSYNVSCDNGFSQGEAGLNVTYYVADFSINITANTTCSWVYCDGHTNNKLKKDWQILKSDLKKEYTFKINDNEQKLKYMGSYDIELDYKQEKDRITFDIKFPDKIKGSLETYIFYYTTAGSSYYIPSTTYPAWIVDNEAKTWFDFAGIEGNINVYPVNSNTWEIEVETTSDNLKVKSIGELNCQYQDQLIEAELPPPILPDTHLQVGVCPEELTGVMTLFFIAGLLLAFFVVNLVYLRIPAINIVLGLGMFFVAYSVMGCSLVVGLAIIVFAVGMIISCFMDW